MRPSRSEERPTSSGFAVLMPLASAGPASRTRVATTAATMDSRRRLFIWRLLASVTNVLGRSLAEENQRHHHEQRQEDEPRPQHVTKEARHAHAGRLGDGL